VKIVIIGGVAGGASAAARLRRLDEGAEIIMFEKGEYISYANCGLPYYIGGTINKKSALTLQTPESFNARFNVDVRVKSEVISIDTAKKAVSVKNHDTVQIYSETYDKIILSPGASPVMLPIPGADNERVFTLRTVPDAFKIREFIEAAAPKSALVVGGGYIGVEMAENLVDAGLDVSIAELAPNIINRMDPDIACEAHAYAEAKGIKLFLNSSLSGIKQIGDALEATVGCHTLKVDMVLMSVGVRPDTALAINAGLKADRRGAIIVNQFMQSSDPDIYAVGDAVSVTDFITGQPAFVPLAGPANRQGRIAADNICGIKSSYKGTQGSAILKLFDMTVASTGINESTAKAAGYDYDKVFIYSGSHAGYYPGATNMSIKVIFNKEDGKLLGAQIAGFDGVDKRIDVLATAIRNGLTASDLTELELVYAPPFSSAKDPVNMVGFVIENTVSGLVSNFHWHDVDDLPRDGSVSLIDVRTEREYSRGNIAGFVNMPLDSLRQHIKYIDKSKPAYVNCFSGARSYLACRILTANGIECKNLSGGIRLYQAMKSLPEPIPPCRDQNK
jgi:NADPH-dependent 2,4-dienoyl-CoA reductase/sulfur reductase-like enzyme/rhodanese-related sulfurtransferase